MKYLLLIAGLLLFSCESKSEEEVFPPKVSQNCDTLNVTFSSTVKGILDSRCNGCHDATNASGGVVLDNYASVKVQVDNTKLLSSIKHDGNASQMPKDQNKLPDCEIQKIERWILNGSPNN